MAPATAPVGLCLIEMYGIEPVLSVLWLTQGISVSQDRKGVITY